MIGSVITKKILAGRAPRSIAASSIDSSRLTSLDCTITATKAMVKVTWAMVMVVIPRPSGQPMNCSSETNSSSSDSPVMTSGMTSGAVIMPPNSVRPRNRPNRAIAMPAMVPSTTEKVALSAAMRSDSQAGDQHLLVMQQPDIPFGRPAAPDGDQTAFVEGIDDQQDDRHVEKRVAERQHGQHEA